MNKRLKLLMFLFLGLFSCFLSSCSKSTDTPPQEDPYGKISLHFIHEADGMPLNTDTMCYTNAAGNHYLITEVQYFISDVVLHGENQNDVSIEAWQDIWYIDNDLPETQNWNISDKIPIGNYDSISFTFGINEEKNQSLMFLNPPERDMFWPEFLGGGYHYLKLNGKWENDLMTNNRPFEFHLGIGQIYKNDSAYVPDIIGFVQNYFTVGLSLEQLQISEGETSDINIVMEIQNWFQNPNVYNHGDYSENTMQSQEAMQKGCENGKKDVFRALFKAKNNL